MAALRARLERLEQRAADQDFALRHAQDRLTDVERVVDRLDAAAARADRIAATTALVGVLPPSTERVSVVMPTRNRAHVLPRALASVRAQSLQTWELIVIDDGSTDATPEILAEAAREDPRIRVMPGDFANSSTARNVALDIATAPYIAYLDDDNLMGPQWLRAVVWAFERHPEAQVGYGARVMDAPGHGPPWIEFETWSRRRMQFRCITDQNVLAHRAGAPEMRYDEALDLGSDWAAALRATETSDPVMIPVVATIYDASGTDRLSERPEAYLRWLQVQRAELRRRPLRVLGVDLASPPLGDEATAAAVRQWRDAGARVGWCAEGRPLRDLGVPSHDDLEPAIDAIDADVVALHARRVVASQLDRLIRAESPFVVVAPEGTDLDDLAIVRDHELCAGVWGPAGPGRDELLDALDLIRVRKLGLPDAEDLLAQAVELEQLDPRPA